MAAIRLSLYLFLVTVLVWLAPSVALGGPIKRTAAGECTITRPDQFKEPGTKNDKGECCSAFYADDCFPPAFGREKGATFYGSNKR
jgi:hypothetical protein